MNKYNSHEKSISKNCDICGKPILIDESGFGKCQCGWINMDIAAEQPDKIFLPNFLTYNHAKELYKKCKPLLPSFDEFLEVLKIYGEMEFIYKNNKYGVIRNENIMLFSIGKQNTTTKYKTYFDFQDRAHINGQLLKNIWYEVSYVNYLE